MNCFYHQDHVAVGVCKSCGKGLCRECATDLGKGLACKGRCEEDVEGVIQLVERNVLLMKSPASRQKLVAESKANIERSIAIGLGSSAWFYLVLGALFAGWGAFGSKPSPFLTAMGALFVVSGGITLFRASRARSTAKELRSDHPGKPLS
jgi:hypothetical protein